MKSIFLFVAMLVLTTFLSACQGNREQNLKKLDELWGYCDNPHRDIKGIDYKICKDKERAAGPSGKGNELKPFDITGFIEKVRNGVPTSGGYGMPTINPYLWQGSLDVTSYYDLKIADSTGGFIQTEWIYKELQPDQRCMIKIQILSAELISTGVKSNFICEKKLNDSWNSDGQAYLEEETQLTLKILETAQVYYSAIKLN